MHPSINIGSLEQPGVHLLIEESESIALPIPTDSAFLHCQMCVSIHNRSSDCFPFVYGRLTPDLRSADMQVIAAPDIRRPPIQSMPLDGMGIPPRQTLIRTHCAKLLRHGDALALQLTLNDYPPDYPPGSVGLATDWLFQPLQAGSCQLRFIYECPEVNVPFLDAHQMVISLLNDESTAQLVSPFITLRLLGKTTDTAVEVDGVRFEVLEPEQDLQISGTPARFPLTLGLKITNQTATAFRFSRFESLSLLMIGATGEVLKAGGGGSLGWSSPSATDFPLVPAGASLFLNLMSYCEVSEEGSIRLVASSERTFYSFDELEFGTYSLELAYRVSLAASEVMFNNLWQGTVYLPPIRLRLHHDIP